MPLHFKHMHDVMLVNKLSSHRTRHQGCATENDPSMWWITGPQYKLPSHLAAISCSFFFSLWFLGPDFDSLRSYSGEWVTIGM